MRKNGDLASTEPFYIQEMKRNNVQMLEGSWNKRMNYMIEK